MKPSPEELFALIDKDELGEAAYQRRLPEFAALSPSEIVPVNLDVPIAVARVFGAIPVLRSHREGIEAQFKLDFALVDALEDYALALYHVHTEYLVTTQPPELKKETLDEGRRLRESMMVDATALVKHKAIDRDQLKGLRRSIGFVNLANDLNVLARVLEKYMRSHSKLALLTREADIQRAYVVSTTILVAVGRRKRRSAESVQASEKRDRVFTLFARTYEVLRKAILHVHGSDKRVARAFPSLWARRERKHQAQKQEPVSIAEAEQKYVARAASESTSASASSFAQPEGTQSKALPEDEPLRTKL